MSEFCQQLLPVLGDRRATAVSLPPPPPRAAAPRGGSGPVVKGAKSKVPSTAGAHKLTITLLMRGPSHQRLRWQR